MREYDAMKCIAAGAHLPMNARIRLAFEPTKHTGPDDSLLLPGLQFSFPTTNTRYSFLQLRGLHMFFHSIYAMSSIYVTEQTIYISFDMNLKICQDLFSVTI